jgi:hypothetical protein
MRLTYRVVSMVAKWEGVVEEEEEEEPPLPMALLLTLARSTGEPESIQPATAAASGASKAREGVLMIGGSPGRARWGEIRSSVGWCRDRWRGESGRKVFAKLSSYSKGTLILTEPGGERFRTQENNLSKDDRKWLADQKTLRGIE